MVRIQGGEPEALRRPRGARPGNTRAASTVRRNGMEWVGETGKYFGLDLQVFRLRRAAFRPHRTGHPATPDPTDE